MINGRRNFVRLLNHCLKCTKMIDHIQYYKTNLDVLGLKTFREKTIDFHISAINFKLNFISSSQMVLMFQPSNTFKRYTLLKVDNKNIKILQKLTRKAPNKAAVIDTTIWYTLQFLEKYPTKEVKHIPIGHPFNDTTSNLELA